MVIPSIDMTSQLSVQTEKALRIIVFLVRIKPISVIYECLTDRCPAFQIQGEPDYPNVGNSGFLSSAPTRPPSRTDNQSPYGNIVSLAAEHAAGNATHPLQCFYLIVIGGILG